MGKRKKNRTPKPDAAPKVPPVPRFDMPERQGPGQLLAIEEFAEDSAANKRRVKNHGEHPLSLAFYRGQLVTVYPASVPEKYQITAKERLAAGEEYRKYWECLHRSGRDSTDMSVGSGSSTSGYDPKAAARRWLKDTHTKMHQRDVAIVQAFCGEGYSAPVSLRAARIDFHANSAQYRIREALDELVYATTGRRGAAVAIAC